MYIQHLLPLDMDVGPPASQTKTNVCYVYSVNLERKTKGNVCLILTARSSDCEVKQCWANMNRDFVVPYPVSRLKYFWKHILVYDLALIGENLQ